MASEGWAFLAAPEDPPGFQSKAQETLKQFPLVARAGLKPEGCPAIKPHPALGICHTLPQWPQESSLLRARVHTGPDSCSVRGKTSRCTGRWDRLLTCARGEGSAGGGGRLLRQEADCWSEAEAGCQGRRAAVGQPCGPSWSEQAGTHGKAVWHAFSPSPTIWSKWSLAFNKALVVCLCVQWGRAAARRSCQGVERLLRSAGENIGNDSGPRKPKLPPGCRGQVL